jgi:hypothetical protein
MYRETFKQYCFEYILTWLKWNLAIPLVAPVIYYYCIVFLPIKNLDLTSPIYNNPFEALKFLFYKGTFVFLGASLLFDIFVDYKEYRLCFSWKKIIYIFFLLLFTGFVFICSLEIISGLPHISFGWQTVLIILCLVVSLIIKRSILIIKFKKEKYYGI